jgi:hypothetical protein
VQVWQERQNCGHNDGALFKTFDEAGQHGELVDSSKHAAINYREISATLKSKTFDLSTTPWLAALTVRFLPISGGEPEASARCEVPFQCLSSH